MGKARGFLPHRWPQWFAPRLFEFDPEPLGPFPGSLGVTGAGDVRIVATHGHTRGHVSVVLEEGPQSVFFAGDTSYTQALMVDQTIDGVAPDERAARETLHRIRELARAAARVPAFARPRGGNPSGCTADRWTDARR